MEHHGAQKKAPKYLSLLVLMSLILLAPLAGAEASPPGVVQAGPSFGEHGPLAVDSSDAWNTFLGGKGFDEGWGIAVDGDGNGYVVGPSTNTWGSPVRAYSGGYDAFVAKVDSKGNLVWNTFLGSHYGTDWAYAVDLDDKGNVYVAGYSNATWDLPVRAYSGGWDAWAAKLDGSGNLIWNSFLGGQSFDWGYAVATDSGGNVFVAGDSDATWGRPVRAYAAHGDTFAAKLDNRGRLIWNTFLGGPGRDEGRGIAIVDTITVPERWWIYLPLVLQPGHPDASPTDRLPGAAADPTPQDGTAVESVYVAGYSDAAWGSPVRDYTSGGDAWAARLDGSGNLAWNTFLGGSGADEGQGIAMDGSGSACIVGHSDRSWGSPVRAFTSGQDAFAARLDNRGNLTWNTFLGGPGSDGGSGIAVVDSGSAYVVGDSNASWGSPARAYTAGADAFAAKVDTRGHLTWNAFLGGSGTDDGTVIAVDGRGNAYVAGSSDATWGSPVRAYSGDGDAWAATISLTDQPLH